MSWEAYAKDWITWAREPGHDAYWDYSPGFFDLLPRGATVTLEIGCGEGRVCRDLTARGYRVTGVDSSPTLLAAAAELQPDVEFVLADAAALPLGDTSFDLVVAYNSLMDMDDLAGAAREAARVLRPDGRFCVCVLHPLIELGQFESREPHARFVSRFPYFGPRRYETTFERNGLSMTFHSWAHSLEEYSRAFEEAGFLVETLREPQHPTELRGKRVPIFLFLRLRLAAL